jgi:hypothetical protein
MFNAKQNELMLKAVDLLHEANCAMQTALGAGDECYELHNAIEDISDKLLDIIQENNPEDMDA